MTKLEKLDNIVLHVHGGMGSSGRNGIPNAVNDEFVLIMTVQIHAKFFQVQSNSVCLHFI